MRYTALTILLILALAGAQGCGQKKDYDRQPIPEAGQGYAPTISVSRTAGEAQYALDGKNLSEDALYAELEALAEKDPAQEIRIARQPGVDGHVVQHLFAELKAIGFTDVRIQE